MLSTKHHFNKLYVLYIVLFASFFNSVLRLDLDGVSLYRVLIPLQILILSLISYQEFKRLSLFICVLSISGAFSLLFSTYSIETVNIVFYSHYFIVSLMFFTVTIMYNSYDGTQRLYSFIKIQFYILLVLGVFNLLGVTLPNMEQESEVINGVFTSENDYSLAIVSFAFVGVFYMKSAVKCFLFFVILMCISFYNDSKVCLIFFLIYYIYVFFKFDFKLNAKFKPAFLIVVMSFFILAINWLFSYEIKFPGGSYRLFDLIIEPVVRIATLEPYGNIYGSIPNRTDLIIYGLLDLFDSFGMGIGFGNTLQMIETSKYAKIGSANSMHNFPLQFFVELGLFLTVFTLWFLLKKTDSFTKVTAVFLLLVSLSQSVGLFSNYYFFICFFYIILLGKHRFQ